MTATARETFFVRDATGVLVDPGVAPAWEYFKIRDNAGVDQLATQPVFTKRDTGVYEFTISLEEGQYATGVITVTAPGVGPIGYQHSYNEIAEPTKIVNPLDVLVPTFDAETVTFYLKGGDRKPVLAIPLVNDDGSPRDLSGVANIKLVVTSVVGGRRIVDMGTMAPSATPQDGIASYTWAGTELTPGNYLMEVILDPGTSNQETFPKSKYYKLTILSHL